MADDIVTRLQDIASQCWCAEKSQGEPVGKPFFRCESCDDQLQAADEIERLREQVRWASDRASEWKLETYQMNTEIELLRAALAIAAGMISTLPPYEDRHPEAVMEMLWQEARRG